jgi:hypothetical protein
VRVRIAPGVAMEEINRAGRAATAQRPCELWRQRIPRGRRGRAASIA